MYRANAICKQDSLPAEPYTREVLTFLCPMKDDMGLDPSAAYSTICQCGKVDVPSRPQLMNTTITLHYYHLEKLVLTEQSTDIGHCIILNTTSLLITKSRCQDQFIRKVTDQAPHE
jgi:hypothetical protein